VKRTIESKSCLERGKAGREDVWAGVKRGNYRGEDAKGPAETTWEAKRSEEKSCWDIGEYDFHQADGGAGKIHDEKKKVWRWEEKRT